MGVRMFQGPCSPHSRRIDSVRPATEPPNLTLSITGSTQESMVHCTHRHTIPLSVCRTMPRFLGRFSALLFVSVDPCSTNKRRWNAHRILGFLGVAHVCHKSKWSYQSRAQSFIYCEAWRYNRFRPPSLCGNTITWCIKLFFFFLLCASLRVPPTANTWLFPNATPGLSHLLMIYSVMQHLTHALWCRRSTGGKDPTLYSPRRSCSDEAATAPTLRTPSLNSYPCNTDSS